MFVLPLSRPLARPARLAVDRLFDQSFERFLGAAVAPATRTPAMDVSETDAAYHVAFDVPGAQRDQLKVSIEGKRLELSTVADEGAAATGEPAAADTSRALYRERPTAAWARTVMLPAEVDQAASEARFENGVLRLTLVKKVPAGATQLRIA